MITSTQITNTEICAVIAVVVFKLLSREILFITKQTNKQTNKQKNTRETVENSKFHRQITAKL